MYKVLIAFKILKRWNRWLYYWIDLSQYEQTGHTLYYIAMCCRNCIYWVEWNANLCWCFADDHHPPPTFTPPELPKKVHVRGTSQAPSRVFFFVFLLIIGPLNHLTGNMLRPRLPFRYRAPSCFVTHYLIASTDNWRAARVCASLAWTRLSCSDTTCRRSAELWL